ncbi:MAG: ParA family protein [Phycisphaerae bacterium]
MRAIAILNQKGGVGKTTTSVNLAAALGRLGRRVMLVDLDPQAHATLHVGIEVAATEPSIYDVLTGRAAMAEVLRDVDEKLTIAPAHIDLAAAELELADLPDRERVLARAVAPYAELFDTLIIDCAPSLGLLTINALAAVTEVIIPLNPHFLALQGLGRLLQTVNLVRSAVQPRLRVSGVAFTMAESSTKLAQEVQADVESFLGAAATDDPWFGAKIYQTKIRRNVKLAECPSFGKTIFQYAPTSHGATDYAALGDEVLHQPEVSRCAAESALQANARPASEAQIIDSNFTET